MTIAIRDVQLEDAGAIVGILNPIIEARLFTTLDAPLTVDAERAFIRTFPARGVFLVACEASGGAVVGLQTVSPFADFTHAFDHVGVIGTFVDLSLRRKGIGAQLFAATFDAARRKGYEKLFSYVRADNGPALAVYLKHGFGIIGTAGKHAKIDGRYVDEIMIERQL